MQWNIRKKTNVKYIQKALVQNLLQFLFCPFIVDFTQKKIIFNAIKYVAL